jgi:putative OPT family oligopeptide transporter
MDRVAALTTRTPDQSGTPQLTARALLTGTLLGALLAPANIYAGLKVGWAFNMAVTSALLSYGLWSASARWLGTRPMHLLENNINQVVASSAAMIASAGLVAAVPALTMLTGYAWTWPRLAGWTFTVSLVGISCALVTQGPLLRSGLRFPSGVATATTLTQMHARGRDAALRLRALFGAGALSALVKLSVLVFAVQPWALPFAIGERARRLTLGKLTFALDPSLLMIAVGMLIGPRAGLSLGLGSLLAWGVLAPRVLARGYVDRTQLADDSAWFGPLVGWLLWPGVTLMVAAALTALALSLRSARLGTADAGGRAPRADGERRARRAWVIAAIVAVIALSVTMQHALFGIRVPVAIGGSALTFLLATVAARVTGETDVTPIGAMGQVTQLLFGLVAPGQVASNLMAANVTGGAASQCADLMQDLKSGQLLGAQARKLAIAQLIGVAVGSVVGSGSYLLLVRDPATMLLTEAWPAPAVATWKAAAEVFARGWHALPPGSVLAMAVALPIGVALALGESMLPARWVRWLPSPASVGLAFVVPASYAISMCAGAALAWALSTKLPGWSERYLLVVAAGTIMGESLTGVSFAMLETLRSLL